jgi:hypothetical protein
LVLFFPFWYVVPKKSGNPGAACRRFFEWLKWFEMVELDSGFFKTFSKLRYIAPRPLTGTYKMPTRIAVKVLRPFQKALKWVIADAVTDNLKQTVCV